MPRAAAKENDLVVKDGKVCILLLLLNTNPQEVSQMHHFFDQTHLGEMGFTGFRPLSFATDAAHIPRDSGVYAVLLDPPCGEFLVRSAGGHFKGKDPTVPIDILEAKWVPYTPTLYIGRAGDLRARIKLLERYGAGEPVAHQGGRYLWQLAGHVRLVVAWRRDDDPVGAESALLEEFEATLGRLPFANLVRGVKPVAFV